MSGGDYHIIKVAQCWNKTNDISFLIPELGYIYAGKLLPGRIFVYKTPLERGGNNLLRIIILYVMRTLRSLLFNPRKHFEVVIASSHYPHDVIPALFLRLRSPNAKFIVYFHGLFPEIPRQKILPRILSLVYNYLGFLILRKTADMIFVFNKHTRNILLHKGINHKKIVLTSNGIEIADWKMVNDEKLFDACFLGRLAENKGILDLVDIWKLVCKLRNDAKLVIIGDGPMGTQLNERIVNKGLKDNVLPLGFIPEDGKYRVLKSSKVFLFPSYLEGWGIAVAEAMACGLPVVAYNLPIYSEVFEDKLITVPVGNVNEMAKQVLFLLENPEVARKIGEESREFVKRYDWRIVGERELSEITTLVNRR